MNSKNCVIFNYIPHKPVKKTNFKVWYNEYYNNLIDLYGITKEIIDYKYPENTFENTEDEFINFCKLLYVSSSKHITK